MVALVFVDFLNHGVGGTVGHRPVCFSKFQETFQGRVACGIHCPMREDLGPIPIVPLDGARSPTWAAAPPHGRTLGR